MPLQDKRKQGSKKYTLPQSHQTPSLRVARCIDQPWLDENLSIG